MSDDMIRAVIYDTAPINGVYRIDSVVVGTPAMIRAGLERGQAFKAVTGDVDDARYDLDLALRIQPRPASSGRLYDTTVAADGVSTLVIDQLQVGTTIQCTGPINDHVTVDDDRLALTFARPGEYALVITGPFPATPVRHTIHAT